MSGGTPYHEIRWNVHFLAIGMLLVFLNGCCERDAAESGDVRCTG